MKSRIPKETLSLLLSAASKTNSLTLGRKTGERTAEDFFLRHSLVSKIKIQDVPNNIVLFFTTYFSYTPKTESNLVFLDDFYGFECTTEIIYFFKGLFEVIYNFLCEVNVEIEVDGFILLIKSK
jgi:hypothetical protein